MINLYTDFILFIKNKEQCPNEDLLRFTFFEFKKFVIRMDQALPNLEITSTSHSHNDNKASILIHFRTTNQIALNKFLESISEN